MPHHVRNIIRFGEQIPMERLKELYSRVLTKREEDKEDSLLQLSGAVDSPEKSVKDEPLDIFQFDPGSLCFDFNTLVPMPNALDITSGSETDLGMLFNFLLEKYTSVLEYHILTAPSFDKVFRSGTADAVSSDYHILSSFLHPDVNLSPFANNAMSRLNKFYSEAKKVVKNNILWVSNISFSPVLFVLDTQYDNILWEKEVENRNGEKPSWLHLFDVDRLKQKIEAEGIDANAYDALRLFLETEEGKALYSIGEVAWDNVKKYGSPTWYEWSYTHWGTKWNSYDNHLNLKGREIAFSTAWSFPTPIMEAMVEAFPDIDFVWKYADEDCGYNTGVIVYKNGKFTMETPEGGSSRGYAIYVECWGKTNCLWQDDNGDWHHYECDEDCPHWDNC